MFFPQQFSPGRQVSMMKEGYSAGHRLGSLWRTPGDHLRCEARIPNTLHLGVVAAVLLVLPLQCLHKVQRMMAHLLIRG